MSQGNMSDCQLVASYTDVYHVTFTQYSRRASIKLCVCVCVRQGGNKSLLTFNL